VLTAALPAGKHRVRIENTGADWVVLARFTLSPYGPSRQALAKATNERVALDAKLNRTIFELDALAAESARWFEAVIAITADHNPLMQEMHGRHRWWKNFARRLSGNRRRPAPIVLADRARDAQRWELAARYYRDALDLEPNESRIWFQCGHALQAAGKASEAAVAFSKAL
jgi:tetratricopeptide (TPR) repeat protein